MGRFDALTQLEENQEPAQQPSAPPVEDTSPVLAVPPQGAKHPAAKRPAAKSLNALQSKPEKFDKYSTYLRPGYKKELKSLALERDCKDYEVLDEALTFFFESRKK